MTRTSLTCRCARRPSFLARQVPVDRFTALATVAAPRHHGPAIGVAAQGPGRVLREIELRDGRVRAFRSDDRGLRLGPTQPAPTAARLRLVINATPDGAVAFYVGATSGAPTRIAGGPADNGLPATRVALTCRGTGSTRIDSIHVAATTEAR